MKNKIITVLLTLLTALPLIAYGILWLYLNTSKIENKLVLQIEDTYNCRAEIRRIRLDPVSLLISLKIEDLKLGKRDHYADEKILPDERPPMSNPQFSSEKIEFKINLYELMNKKLIFDSAVSTGSKIYLSTSEGFPEILSFRKDRTGRAADASGFQFLPEKLQEIKLQEANIEIQTEYRDRIIKISPGTIDLKNISIDMDHLDVKNSVDTSFQITLRIAEENKEKSAGILINTNAMLNPVLNEKTKQFSSEYSSRFVIKGNSHLTNPPFIEALSKDKSLEKIGIDLSALSKTDTLRGDLTIPVSYTTGRIVLNEKSSFHFNNYTLTLDEGSYVSVDGSNHKFLGTIQLSSKLSKKILSSIDQSALLEIRKKRMRIGAKELRDQLLEKHLDNHSIMLDFISTGDIEEPESVLQNALPSWDAAYRAALQKKKN